MLHILTEGNSELNHRVFPIPDNVRKLLRQTLKNYDGDKTVDGYKRLNNLLSSDTISYHELKRIKNFFDNYNGTDESVEYILNGGTAMKNWVDNTLKLATKAVQDFKQAKKDAGIKNAFIKPHEKDRQNKKKNKPTQVKFNTDNANRNMLNNTPLRYEGLIRESIDIEDYYYEYGVTYVLDSFLSSKKGSRQDWGVLINPSMYQKALSDFVKNGRLTTFPSKYIYQWIGILFRNTVTLEANTELAGHTQTLPIDEISDFLESYFGDKFYKIQDDDVYFTIDENEFIKLCGGKDIYINESQGVHKDGQYDLFMNQEETDEYDRRKEILKNDEKYGRYLEMADEYNKKSYEKYGATDKIIIDTNKKLIFKVEDVMSVLDDIGLYDWMQMPDGSDAISDYGIQPIIKLLDQYKEDSTPEETLVIVNKVLDVYHQRGDLSSIFIQGGRSSLSKVSNGIAEERGRKTIFITEEQSRMIKEAMDDTFSLEELTSLPSFNAKMKYCTQHLGKPIGKGSSRVTFQMDDEKVLKLAWNNKGVAQNTEEERAYGDDIFPQVFQSDDNGSWLVSEFVLPANAKDFKHCFGITFDDFTRFIMGCGAHRFGDSRFRWYSMPYNEWERLLENNEDLASFDDYIGNYGTVVIGDMTRLCNYGLTQRNGEPHIVLLDSGLTDYVWNNFYKKW